MDSAIDLNYNSTEIFLQLFFKLLNFRAVVV